MELGGKSPNIFMPSIADEDDAFYDKCVEGAVLFAVNQGEDCTCPSRILVHEDIYDDFYANIYMPLWHSSKETNEFEQVTIQEFMLADKPITTVKVLDMCCGVAPHACFFKELGVEYLGVDISSSMLQKARNNCPGQKFQKGNMKDASLFSPKSFSGCMLLGFSIYEFPNPKTLSDNAYLWIQPGGEFLVHLIEPDKFDPMLDLASPFAAFSLQKYSYDRQTKSQIYFDDFKYSGEFKKKMNEDDASFDEIFTFYNTPNAVHITKV